MFWLFALVSCAGGAWAAEKKLLIDADPFCEYVGKWVELRRPVAVVERSSRMSWRSHGITSKQKVDYGLIEISQTNGMKVFGTLPVGHKVLVTDVRDELLLDDQQMMAYGGTTLPWNNKKVTFAYSWGAVWTLWPAPWEPDGTPKQRGPEGKLPPHFDYPMFRLPADAPKWGLHGCNEGGTNAASNSGRDEDRRVPDAARVPDAPRIPDTSQKADKVQEESSHPELGLAPPSLQLATPLEPGKSLVCVYRPRRSFPRDKMVLMMDGKKVAYFFTGAYLPFAVEPGRHKFEYRIESSMLLKPGMSAAINMEVDDHWVDIVCEPGATNYIAFGDRKFWIKQVEEAEALREMAQCVPVGPKNNLLESSR